MVDAIVIDWGLKEMGVFFEPGEISLAVGFCWDSLLMGRVMNHGII